MWSCPQGQVRWCRDKGRVARLLVSVSLQVLNELRNALGAGQVVQCGSCRVAGQHPAQTLAAALLPQHLQGQVLPRPCAVILLHLQHCRAAHQLRVSPVGPGDNVALH